VLLRSGSAGQAGDENLLGEGRLSKTQARQLEELASNKLFANVLESLRRNQ
jgi:hypothetical protein